jgi:hypothetical protein
MEEDVHVEYAGESIDADDVNWFSSLPGASWEYVDPLHGLRPEGTVSRLWAQSDDDEDIHSSLNIKHDSPPTTSIDRA